MKKSGFYFLEGMPIPGEQRPKAGTQEPEKWQPYKLWAGDRWECEGCGAVIVSGVGSGPIAEHYQDDFEKHVKTFGAAQFQVNDC